MKKLLLVCCIVIGISTLSHAQGGRQRQTPEQQTAALKTSLALTDAQAAKVMAIYTAQAKTNDSLRTAANGDMQSMMQAMAPIRAKYTAQIKAVLTPEQAATFQKAQDERMKMMQQGGGMGGPPPPPQR